MTTKIQFLRTNTQQARPDPNNSNIVDGTPFLNFCRKEPGLYFKLDDNTICKIGPTHVGSTEPHANAHSAGYTEKSNGETWLDTSNSEFPVFKVFQIDKNIEIEENDPDATEKQAIRRGRWVTPRLVLSRADVNNRDDDETNGGALIYGSNGELMVNEGEDSPTAFWINQGELKETEVDVSDPENPGEPRTTRAINTYWYTGSGKKVGIGDWTPAITEVTDPNTNITTTTITGTPEADLDIKGTLRLQNKTNPPEGGEPGMLAVSNKSLIFYNGESWITLGSTADKVREGRSDWFAEENADPVNDPNPKYIENKPRTITQTERDKLTSIAENAAANVNADWDATSGDAKILNKPDFLEAVNSDSTLTGSGTSTDPLKVATPFVPSDWDEGDASGASYIKNKPDLHAVATSGDYDDLTNKPTLPDTPAHVATAKKYELNVPATSGDPAWVEATAPAGSGGGLTSVETDSTITGDGTSGNALSVATPFTNDLKSKLDAIPRDASPHIQSDWSGTSKADGGILNKPSLFSGRYEDLIARPTAFNPAFTNNSIDLDYLKTEVTSRLLPSTLGTAGQVLRINAGATGVEYATPTTSSGAGSSPYVERYKQDITSLIRNNFSSWLNLTLSASSSTIDINLPSTIAISAAKLYKAELNIDFNFSFRNPRNELKNMVIYSLEKTINVPQTNVQDTRDSLIPNAAPARSDNIRELLAGRELIANSNSGTVGSLFDFWVRLGFAADPIDHAFARLQFGKVSASRVLVCSLRPWAKGNSGLTTSYQTVTINSVKVAIYELDL